MLRKRGVRAEEANGAEEKKPETGNFRLAWVLTALAMLAVLAVGCVSISRNFSGARMQGFELKDLPPMPDLGEERLAETLDSGKKLVEEYSRATETQWAATGEKYLAGRDFLAGEEFSALKLEKVERQDGETVLTYGQYYKDVRVSGGGVILRADNAAGTVTGAEDHLVRGLRLAVDPALTAKAAAEIAAAQPEAAGMEFNRSSLLVVRAAGEDYLVWDVVLRSAESGTEKSVWVGALHGNVIPREEAPISQGT